MDLPRRSISKQGEEYPGQDAARCSPGWPTLKGNVYMGWPAMFDVGEAAFVPHSTSLPRPRISKFTEEKQNGDQNITNKVKTLNCYEPIILAGRLICVG